MIHVCAFQAFDEMVVGYYVSFVQQAASGVQDSQF